MEQKSRELTVTTHLLGKNLDLTLIQKFLNHVANSEEEEAREMLKITPLLAWARGTIKDQGERVFENMTGFQYAVWALDKEMWEMILSFFDQADMGEAKAQLDLLKQMNKEGCLFHFDLEPLTDALKNYPTIEEHLKCGFTSSNEAANKKNNQEGYWINCVGGEQRKLPVYLVQKYCNTLGFNPKKHNREIKGYNLHIGTKFPDKVLLRTWYSNKDVAWCRSDGKGAAGCGSTKLAGQDLQALETFTKARTTQLQTLEEQLAQYTDDTPASPSQTPTPPTVIHTIRTPVSNALTGHGIFTTPIPLANTHQYLSTVNLLGDNTPQNDKKDEKTNLCSCVLL